MGLLEFFIFMWRQELRIHLLCFFPMPERYLLAPLEESVNVCITSVPLCNSTLKLHIAICLMAFINVGKYPHS